jgi:ribosomal protein L29
MNSVVVYRGRGAITDSFGGSGSGGGGVDDVLRRLGNVETDVSELRAEVRAISATLPHLAKAASVSEILAVTPHLATKADLKSEIGEVRAEIGSLRTEMKTELGSLRTEMTAEIGSVRTEIAGVKTAVATLETAIIKWIVGTTLTTAGVAFTIAKFVH